MNKNQLAELIKIIGDGWQVFDDNTIVKDGLHLELDHSIGSNWRFCLKPEIRNYGNMTTISLFPLWIRIWWN